MITADAIRANFPELQDSVTYTDATLAYWLDTASLLLAGWPTRTVSAKGLTVQDTGISLFVAHNMIIEARDAKAAANGGVPGVASSSGVGAVSSKTVDKATVAYDAASTINPEDGAWNLTTYGSRFAQLARLVGMGPVQVGAGFGGFVSPQVPQPAGYPPWSGPVIDL